jgi:hypothetical protein
LKSCSSQASSTNLDLTAKRDPLLAITVQCKEDQEGGDPFVRRVVTSPEPSVILASDQQLDDLAKFCTHESNFSVFQVDPTYNLGAFSVTATQYDHLLLVSRTTDKPPLIIGPMLLHLKKETTSYDELVGFLTAKRPALQSLKVLGTDGETAIAQAFKERCENMLHLLCSIHFRRNIKRKLQELALPQFIISDILSDIFGRQIGTIKETGLIDSEDAAEFRVRLQQCQKIWDGRELPYSPDRRRKFYSWFLKYKADDMEEHMILSIRKKAKLPDLFSTNKIECVNSMISDETNHKQHDMVSFARQMKAMCQIQRREIEWAIIDKGPFQLHPSLRHLQVPETEWFVNMNPDDRLAYVSMVLGMNIPAKESLAASSVCPSNLHVSNLATTSSFSTQADVSLSSLQPTQTSRQNLSIGEEEIKKYITTLPKCSIEGMYKKACELVNSPGNITQAPGCPDDARVVASRSGIRPHIVMPGKAKGQFLCESSCINWKSYGICSHILATAHSANKLLPFLQWFAKCGTKKANLTNSSYIGMPLHSGRKGSVGPRKRSTTKPAPLKTFPRNTFQEIATSSPGSAQLEQQFYQPREQHIQDQQQVSVTVPQHHMATQHTATNFQSVCYQMWQ